MDLAALAAGKHVLCEKPYTRHPEQVDEAWDAAEAAGLVLMEAFMWRHTPQADRLVALLPRIGELVAVRSTFSHRLRDDADIRVSAPLEGGALMDVGCYCVSGARLIAGQEPELVYGQQITTADGVDRRFAGLLRFPSGLVATFHAGFDAFSELLEVIGREGTISLPDPWHSTQGLLLLDGEEDRVEPRQPLPVRAGRHGSRHQGREGAPTGPSRRAGPGSHHRGALSLSRQGRAGQAGGRQRLMPPLAGGLIVFFASAAVLVLEILAVRLLAPHLGVTLEVTTGVIGTVLAGIVLGTWLGGRLADLVDPRRLLGPILMVGGVLAIAVVPTVSLAAGLDLAPDAVGILLFAGAAFFLPAAVLSAASPTVVKIQLRHLGETGRVVGRYSALGTAGAIAGSLVISDRLRARRGPADAAHRHRPRDRRVRG